MGLEFLEEQRQFFFPLLLEFSPYLLTGWASGGILDIGVVPVKTLRYYRNGLDKIVIDIF